MAIATAANYPAGEPGFVVRYDDLEALAVTLRATVDRRRNVAEFVLDDFGESLAGLRLLRDRNRLGKPTLARHRECFGNRVRHR